MHVQVLASGSGGNATLVRAGETTILVDAGLGPRALSERLAAAGVGPRGLDHIVVTHGHLDHSRSAGILAKRHGATLHCAESYMSHPAFSRSERFSALPIGGRTELAAPDDAEPVVLDAVALPHDCDPTVALRLEHDGEVCVVLTDMGEPRLEIARQLQGAQLLVLEFNYDPEMLAAGPYPLPLRRRIAGGRGHLSNEQSMRMLEWLAGDDLATLILAPLSATNNTPQQAEGRAQEVLMRLGLHDTVALIAEQDTIGPNLAVRSSGLDAFIPFPTPPVEERRIGARRDGRRLGR